VLSFGLAPCVSLGGHDVLRGQVGRRRMASPSGVLMGTDDRGIHPHRPLHGMTGLRALITTTTQLIKDLDPGPIRRPAAMPVVDGLPVPVVARQIPPGTAGAGPPQHPVDHRSMISPPPTPARRLIGQQRFQPGPLLLSQVMTIVHRNDLPHPTQKIHGTRPKSALLTTRWVGRGVGGEGHCPQTTIDRHSRLRDVFADRRSRKLVSENNDGQRFSD
jgi:hypothetical protein